MDQLALPHDTSAAGELFHCPVPALFADLDTGSGAVRLTEGFEAAAPVVRHRVLRDWLRALRSESDRALIEMFRDFTVPLDRLSIVEQIDLFKRSCRDQDVACPTDFAVLLQQI